MTLTLNDGSLTRKAATEKLLYQFDWSELPPLAAVQTNVVTAAAIYPPNATPLVLDFLSFTTRATAVRIGGGDPGAEYLITNTITTNEAPDQTFVATFELLIEA